MNKKASHVSATEAEAPPNAQEGAQAAQPAAPAPAAADGAAVVRASAPVPAQPPALDAHHGVGGLYEIVNGQRVLKERSVRPEDVQG